MKKPDSITPYSPLPNDSVTRQDSFNNKEEKYRAIIENSIHAFFLTVPDGIILEANHAATVMFGYSPDEFKHLKRWQFIDHNDPNLIQALELREKNSFAMTEATGIKKNGEHFPVEITSAVFIDIDGVCRSSTMVSDISERKKTEAAMRLSNERFDLVAKATNDLVWDWDLVTGEIYRSGSSLADVYGHNSNEFIKNIQSWAGFLHPHDKDNISQQIAHLINSKEETAFNFEYRFRREDGTYVYINDKGYIIRNEEGKATRMIGAARDITEQKKAALALEESEQRYKMFVEQSTEGIWRIESKEVIDITATAEEMFDQCFKNSFIAECNDAYAQMYGFEKAAELIGIPLNKLWPKENVVSIEFITNFFKNGFKATNEISYEYNRNGEQVIFINTMAGIVKDNSLTSVWGIRSDITEQKKAEQALAESETHLRTIVQANPECIKLLDEEGIILEMNPTGLALIEADSLDQVVGKNALNIVMPEHRVAFKRLVHKVFEGNAEKLVFEIKGFKGRQLWLETHCVPLRNTNGDIIAALSVTRDITKKVQLENSLNEERQIRQQQITEAVITGQEKERTLLGQELHDNINQILASTKLYIECAQKSIEPREDLLNESRLLIEKAMIEIRNLSKSLLPPSLGEVGLLQALSEMADNIKEVNELNISIDWNDLDKNELSNKLKLTIFRIVQEQLNNVIKHAEAKNVWISIKKAYEMIQVSVKDDGCGFDTALKRNGVGLRNITSRAEVNNGVVFIDSRPGKGCELLVNFPAPNAFRQTA
ncbi:MAG: PAS domain S-box protein [Ferruginibacter sp.]